MHLWDHSDNPIFWLPDRTLLQHMIGDYETRPDRYTLLYAAYDAIFFSFSDEERAWLFHRSAEHWYAGATVSDP